MNELLSTLSDKQIKSVLCHASVGMAVVDIDGTFVFVNESFAKLHHREISDFDGYNVMFDPNELTDQFKIIHTEFQRGERESFRAEIEHVEDNGDRRWYSIESTLVRGADGAPQSIVVINHDVTERKQIERRILESEERAQQANRMKTNFLANMSHEIRTPLGAILGFTELLANSSTSESQRIEYLGIITRNSLSLSRIVDDILDLSKVEAGLMTLEKIAFCPRTLIGDIITLFSESARLKNLTLESKFASDVPETLLSDPLRLKQVINNLVSNALKFTESGGVSIDVTRLGSTIQIGVEDSGPGISPAHVATLFQPFIQGDDSMTRKYGGTGLGLHLSRKLSEALGGTLNFGTPKSLTGSRFEVSIPLIETTTETANQWCAPEGSSEHSSERAPATMMAVTTSPKDLDGIRILVVDDAPDNRKLLERLLIRNGALVSFADDGRSAVEQASKSEFELILMDLQMPDLDGFAATKMIRERGVIAPVVALTAHAVNDVRDRCVKAGFSEFMTKPVSSLELVKAVKNLVAKAAHIN